MLTVREPWQRVLAIAGLAAIVFVVFAPSLSYEFVWDDHEQIVHNPRLTSWKELPRFFGGDVLSLTRGDAERSNYYRPLFLAHYLVNYQLFGPRPAAWHGLAIGHHLLTSLLVFAFARKLGASRFVGGASAALFALHPAHGESVVWVAASFNDPPAATLVLLSMLLWMRGVEGNRRLPLVGASLAFLAALGFKESALAAPILALLVARYRFAERGWRSHLRDLWPFGLALAVYFTARVAALGSFVGRYPAEPGWSDLLPTLPRLAVEYLRFLVWPWGFAPSYPLRLLPGWTSPASWLSLVGLVLVAALLVRLGRRRPWLLFAALWSAVAALPALNVRGFRPTYLVHQRYLYLAAFGLCFALALAVEQWNVPHRTRVVLVAAVLLVWAVSLRIHDEAWRSDEALWRRIAEADPANPASFDWLGSRAMRAERLDEAETLFRASLEAEPEAAQGACNLATLLFTRRSNPAAARPWFEKAVAGFERDGRSNESRASCEVNAALCRYALGEPRAALDQLRSTLDRPPHSPLAARNGAVLARRLGEPAIARDFVTAGLSHHPTDPMLLAMSRDLGQAPVASTD